MARPAFDEKEFEVKGMYPGIERFEVSEKGRTSIPETPIYNRPISVRENWKLLFEGRKPYWIPTTGWIMCEQNQFRPRLCPDNVGNHQIFDGGPAEDYDKLDRITRGWFDLKLEWEPMASGATVRPGDPKVKDINCWEDYVSIPNLDEVDWEQYLKENREYLSIDKMNQLGIQFGLWERLMCLMDVDKAAVALIDDEQKEGVHRFFDRLCDFYDDYIGRIAALYDIQGVYFHDDWAHQNGPFFSVDTAMEMLLPYMKRLVESAHKRGLYFEHHCCGKAEMLVPVMIEAGVDMWCGQEINDQDMLAQKYKEAPIVLGVRNPPIPQDGTDDELRKIAKEWVNRYKDCRIGAMFAYDTAFETQAFQKFVRYVYEYSRKAFCDFD